jgi:uncharacterized protein involved in outer membrane biogenesis
MKTFLQVSLFGLLVVLVAGYLVVAYSMGSVVKAGVNRVGPKLTQSRVELAGAKLSPLTGAGTLSGLTVGNPTGWSNGNAFTLAKVSLDLEPKSVFGDTIIINEIIIDQPEFNYETRIMSSNIQDLLKNIQQATGGGKDTETKDGPPKKFIVKKFRLTNAKATVIAGGAAVPVPLPAISLDDLGVAEGGLTGGQLAAAIMKPIVAEVINVAAGAIGQIGSSGNTSETVKQVGKAMEELLKKKP